MSGLVADFDGRLADVYGRASDGEVLHRLELRRAGDADVSITRALCEGTRSGALEHPSHHLLVLVGDGDAVFTTVGRRRVTADSATPVLLQCGERYSYVVTATQLTLLQISDRMESASPQRRS